MFSSNRTRPLYLLIGCIVFLIVLAHSEAKPKPGGGTHAVETKKPGRPAPKNDASKSDEYNEADEGGADDGSDDDDDGSDDDEDYSDDYCDGYPNCKTTKKPENLAGRHHHHVHIHNKPNSHGKPLTSSGKPISQLQYKSRSEIIKLPMMNDKKGETPKSQGNKLLQETTTTTQQPVSTPPSDDSDDAEDSTEDYSDEGPKTESRADDSALNLVSVSISTTEIPKTAEEITVVTKNTNPTELPTKILASESGPSVEPSLTDLSTTIEPETTVLTTA